MDVRASTMPNCRLSRPSRARGLSRLPYHAGPALALVAELELGLQGLADRALGDDAALDLGARRYLEHRVEQRLFDDRFERPRARLAREGELRDRVEAALLEDQLDVVEREELLVLLDERVLRLGEDADDVLLVQVVQRDDDRQAAHELGDEPVLQQVLRL